MGVHAETVPAKGSQLVGVGAGSDLSLGVTGASAGDSSKSRRDRCSVIEPGLASGPGLLVLGFPAPLHGLSGWLSLYET